MDLSSCLKTSTVFATKAYSIPGKLELSRKHHLDAIVFTHSHIHAYHEYQSGDFKAKKPLTDTHTYAHTYKIVVKNSKQNPIQGVSMCKDISKFLYNKFPIDKMINREIFRNILYQKTSKFYLKFMFKYFICSCEI